MIPYKEINLIELESVVGREHYKLFSYIFESKKGIKVLQWYKGLTGVQKKALYNGGLSEKFNVMCTIYFDDSKENNLYGIILPVENKINPKRLGRLIGINNGREAKGRLLPSKRYPTNQQHQSLSPFITGEDELVKIFHVINYPDGVYVDHSYPGRGDISLIMTVEGGINILQGRKNIELIKIKLEDIAKFNTNT